MARFVLRSFGQNEGADTRAAHDLWFLPCRSNERPPYLAFN
jgi:hypothetical protein